MTPKILMEIEKKYPFFLRGSHLIEMGLYKNHNAIFYAMQRNKSPPFIKLSEHKIIFPRILFLNWLKKYGMRTISDD